MPERTVLHSDSNPMPIFAKRHIDSISNLKVGDYLIQQRNFIQEDGHATPHYGITRAWDIIRITKKCVYINYCMGEDKYQEIRLAWNNINQEVHPDSLYRGYLNNNSYQLCFHEYVKQEDMNIEPFLRNRETD